jgi:hypothetical protein
MKHAKICRWCALAVLCEICCPHAGSGIVESVSKQCMGVLCYISSPSKDISFDPGNRYDLRSASVFYFIRNQRNARSQLAHLTPCAGTF